MRLVNKLEEEVNEIFTNISEPLVSQQNACDGLQTKITYYNSYRLFNFFML